MRDEKKIRIKLLFRVLAEQLLLFGIKILHVRGLILKLFHQKLFGFHELDHGDFRYFGNVRVQKLHFVLIFRFQKVHNISEGTRFHVHDVLEAVDKAHLEVHGNVLVEVAAGVVVFRAEHGRDLEDSFVHRDERLFIELRRLREIHLLAEIIELENVGAPLRAREVDLRGMNFRKALRHEIFPETALDSFLKLENSALFGISERHGAIVEIGIQIALHLFFRDDHRGNIRRIRQDLYVVDLQLVTLAPVPRFARDDLARQFHRTLFFKLGRHTIIGKGFRIDALDSFARRAQDNESKIGHHADIVHGARNGDLLIFVVAELRIRDGIRLRFACDFHN